MWHGYEKRVKLMVDLTRYHSKLTVGQEGTIIPDKKLSFWGGGDDFGAVKFDCGAYLDIVIKNLEFLEDKSKAKE